MERFGFTKARKVSTPLHVTALAADDSCKLEDPKMYQALIGILNYIAVGTRPDISYTVQYLSK